MMIAGRNYGTRMIQMLRDRFLRGVVVKDAPAKGPERSPSKPTGPDKGYAGFGRYEDRPKDAPRRKNAPRQTPLSRAPD